MSVAPIKDWRRSEAKPGPPVSPEAEVGVIGAALTDNSIVPRLERLEARHFDDVFMGRIWAAIQAIVADGDRADAVTVVNKVGGDKDTRAMLFEAWDGGIVQVADTYADLLIELHQRRQVIAAAEEAIEAAKGGIPSVKVIGDLEAGLLALAKRERRVDMVSAAQAADDVLADLDSPDGDPGAVSTQITALDDHLGAFLPDDMILIAGRPGAGKSALGSCIALNVARTGLGVIEINAEMNPRQMMRRHLTDLCFSEFGRGAPTYKDIRRRQVTYDQRRQLGWAADHLRGLPLYMVKRTGLTLSSLRALVRRQAALWEAQGAQLGLITVDHVGLLQADGGGRDRYTDQTDIAIGMKALADELKIPVIALVQLNRRVEQRDDRRPQLSDLRDSGAWEENADTVIGVYREAYYALKEQEPKTGGDVAWNDWDTRRKSKVVEAVILKVREGEENTVKLWASIGHNAIRSHAPEGELL